jgi:WD40 repeat protein
MMAFLSFTTYQQYVRASQNEQIALEQKGIAEEKAIEAEKAREEEAVQRQIAEEAQKLEAEARALAEQNEIQAEAQRSAARAQIYQGRPGDLDTSTLLAIDSMRRAPSDEAEEIIRSNIRLLPLPVTQLSQAGKINDLAFNHDRSIFVTASADGTACAWRIEETVSEIFCTPSDQSAVNAAAFSPDDSLIAIGDQSGLVQVLEAATGNVLYAYRRVEPENSTVELADVKNGSLPAGDSTLRFAVRKLSFRPPNGQQLAVAYDDGEIPVFNASTGKISSPLYTGRRPNVMGFSPNGTWLVVGSETGGVSVWNLATPNDPFPSFTHRGEVLALAFSSKDNKVASAGNDNTAVINLSIKQELFRIANQTLIRDLAFSPDGSRLVTASADRRIRVWDTLNGVERLAMAQDGSVTEIVFSANGRWLASTGDDRTVRVWAAATGEEIFQIPLKASGARLAFCNEDRWLVSTDESGAIRIWDISIMTVPDLSRSTPSDSLVDHIQYSPSGERLAVSSENSFWLLTSDPESILRERELSEQSSPFESKISRLVFSPDSTQLGLLTEGNELARYEVERGALEMLTPPSLVEDIAFSPDSRQLIVSTADGSLQAWDAASGQWIESLEQEYTLAFTLATSSRFLAIGSSDQIYLSGIDSNGGIPPIPASGENGILVFNNDGSLLATTDSTGRVSIWSYQDGKFTSTATFDKARAVSLAFNPEGSLLAVGTPTHVYLVDGVGKELARIPHLDTVNGVSFSGDGKYLATASSTLLQLWEIDKIQLIQTDQLIPIACSRLYANLDPKQWTIFFGNEKYKTLCDDLPVPE